MVVFLLSRMAAFLGVQTLHGGILSERIALLLFSIGLKALHGAEG
jgi:hypothetical protein